MSQSIAIVEDDIKLGEMISEFLSGEGFSVNIYLDGKQAIEQIPIDNPDLVVLDVMLPKVDGVEVCRNLRKTYQKPILMLSASGNDFAEISSLNLGADSYLSKPIKPQVLLAHIQAALRRYQSGSSVNPTSSVIRVQDVMLDKTSLCAIQAEMDLRLTTAEFDLLWLLMTNAGSPVSRDVIYQEVRGIEYDGLDRSVDLRISNLRRKLKDEVSPYQYLKTVRNKGYMFALS